MQRIASMPTLLPEPPRTVADHDNPGAAGDPGRTGDGVAPAVLRQLERIAVSSVRLAALGPDLAALASRMQEHAALQARHAGEVSEAARQLSDRLGAVVGRLRQASGGVHDVMDEITRIADQTRILSINASIEAGRAGEQGRAFNVVACEVKELADQTRTSTRAIVERVEAIQGSVREVAATLAPAAGTVKAEVTVQGVHEQVRRMAETAAGQRDGAESLNAMGEQTNALARDLLLAVGTFRLGAHRRGMQEVRLLLPELARLSAHRRELEENLLDWLRRHPGFELLYVTDPAGRQITDNLGWSQGRTQADPAGWGRDWRQRPWFQAALRAPHEVAVSDVYRSEATGDYCFTLSAVFADADGHVRGVLGADVNFQKLTADGR
jgi:hypothetical protein